MWILDHLGEAVNLDFYHRILVTTWSGTTRIQGELVSHPTYSVLAYADRDNGRGRELSPKYDSKEAAEKVLQGFIMHPTPAYFYAPAQKKPRLRKLG